MSENFPYSQACENNKQAILDVFEQKLQGKSSVLEIGGGTGQHAVFFGDKFPNISWQSTDVAENITTLNLRIAHAELKNVPLAFTLNADDSHWSAGKYDAIFTANTLHIMSSESVEKLFAKLSKHLNVNGIVLAYGPFKYAGEFTTDSNASFDLWLKGRNSNSGVRDFERVDELAKNAGLTLLEDNSMPACNQLLVWTKPE
jgi:cyclopropane fatty-acyl-phospholipid synthase-like methyltransferase